MPQERRQSERIGLQALATLRIDELALRSQLVNVSLGGALLELEQELPSVRDGCYLTVAFGRDPEEALVLPVAIVGVGGSRARLKWQRELDAVDVLKLRRLKECELPPVRVVNGRLPMLVWPGLLTRDEIC
jgi:hypothetical protein